MVAHSLINLSTSNIPSQELLAQGSKKPSSIHSQRIRAYVQYNTWPSVQGSKPTQSGECNIITRKNCITQLSIKSQ